MAPDGPSAARRRRRLAGVAVVVLPVLYALTLPLWLVFYLRNRVRAARWEALLRREGVEELRIEGEGLLVTRSRGVEVIPLSDVRGGRLTLVDYCGAFADAGEAGARLDLQLVQGPARAFALRYYLERDEEALVAPLRERGLLVGPPRLVRAPRLGLLDALTLLLVLTAVAGALSWLALR